MAGGNANTAIGYQALQSNQTGIENTALGQSALNLTTGSGNVAVGVLAGGNITTGKDNIDIVNQGTNGDNGIIRIGGGQQVRQELQRPA